MQGKACTLQGKNDVEDYNNLVNAMEVMGFAVRYFMSYRSLVTLKCASDLEQLMSL